MNTKQIKLPQRTQLSGWDYNSSRELRMTGREWHTRARRETFKTERGNDAAWGGGVEVYLDGKPMGTDLAARRAEQAVTP
jgi:hypothetical protein